MNAFHECRGVEQSSFEILMPYLAEATDDGRYVLTDKGRLAATIQQTHGDVIAQKNGEMVCIEVKAEEADLYGNAFLEEWSNRSRFNPGWLLKLETDFLFYHFIKDDRLYVFDFPDLQRWAFTSASHRTGFPGRLYDFNSKPQAKRQQRNDTWGRCVPLDVLCAEVKSKVINPRTGRTCETGAKNNEPQQPSMFGVGAR